MSSVQLRPATQADIASVLELWRRGGPRPSPTDSDGALTRLIERDPAALLVAESGGQVVGTLIVGWDGWRGSFYRLSVDPGSRRRGIASALIRAGEERLRALGAERLTAIVVDGEEGAAELWTAAGYERQPGVGRFVRMLDG